MAIVNNFTALESVYGKFIVNRHCAHHAEYLVKTGRTHMEAELKKILSIVATLPDNPVIVDAGANIGMVSIPVGQAVKPRGGVIHAFEVQRMLFYALCGSAALNDLDNLRINNKAVGAAPGSLRVPKLDYGRKQDFGLLSLVDQQSDYPSEQVEVVTIDSLGLPTLDFLKIDVEGMEIEVLAGAAQSLRAHQPWCWIEYWKVDINAIKRQFEGADYRLYVMDKLNLLCAPKRRLDGSGLTIQAEEV